MSVPPLFSCGLQRTAKSNIGTSHSKGSASAQARRCRLNSAIGYITPKDMLAGHQQEIQADRDRKLEAARKQRQIRRQQAA